MPARRQPCSLPRLRPTVIGVLIAMSAAGSHAQVQPQLPDAGRLLEQLRDRTAPAPAASTVEPPRVEEPSAAAAPQAGDVRVRVEHFSFSGATRVGEAELAATVADLTAREVSYAELSEAAARITRLYRSRGYLVARAILPPQEIKDGEVRIEVREGQLGEVKVERGRNVRLAQETVEHFVNSLEPGSVIREHELESALLTLSDVPGVVVRSVLRPGAQPGTADLLVQVEENEGVQAQFGFDNAGSRATGRNRLTLDVTLNDMLGAGEAIGLRSMTTLEGLSANTLMGSIPVGGSGLRVGGSYTYLIYDIGRGFESLHANGTAEASSGFVSMPLWRGRGANLNAQVAVERKHFTDRIDAVGTITPKQVNRTSVGLSGDFRDSLAGDAFTSASLTVSHGRLARDSVADAAADAIGANTQGGFGKAEWSLARLQALPGGWTLRASLAGQRANRNLDSSEEFYLGGAQGVRAFPQGEASGDEGQLARLELRRVLGTAHGFQVEGAAFYDVGHVRIDHTPWDPTQASNDLWLRGAGLGVSFVRPSLAISASIAMPAGHVPPTIQRAGPMFWLQVSAAPQFLNTRRLVTATQESMDGDPFEFYGSLGLQAELVSRTGPTPIGPRGATQSATPTGIGRGAFWRVSDPSSNVGARGATKLGDGLEFWWQGELGVSYDWSNRGNDPMLPEGHASTSMRDTAAGLRDPAWGSVLFGHWDMPLRAVTAPFDPFDDDGVGAASTFMGSPGFGVGGSNTPGPMTTASDNDNDDATFVRRQPAVFQYWTPTWRGLSARFAWSDNRRHAAPDVGEGRIWGLSVGWKYENWLLMAGYEQHDNYFGIASLGRNNRGVGSTTAVTAGTSSTDRASRLGVQYDFGRTKVSYMVDRLSYSEDGVIPGNTVPDLRTYSRLAHWVGVAHTIDRLELRASAGKALAGQCSAISGNPALATCSTDGLGAKMWALGFSYKVTEPLSVFGQIARIQNNASSSYNFRVGGVFASTGNSPGVGSDPRAVGIGFKYRF